MATGKACAGQAGAFTEAWQSAVTQALLRVSCASTPDGEQPESGSRGGVGMSPQRGCGWLSPARKQRRGRGWPQGEVMSPAPGGLPGAQAPQGLDAVPPQQALSVVPPSPWSPALQGASVPQRGLEYDWHQRSAFIDGETEAWEVHGSPKMVRPGALILCPQIYSEWGPGQVASLSLGFYSLKWDNGPPLVDRLHGVILSHSRISGNVTISVHLRTAHLDKCPEHSPHNSKGHNTSGKLRPRN